MIDKVYQEYFENLGNLYKKVEVTNQLHRPLPLEEGMEAATQTIAATVKQGKKVIIIGNGGSAAIASHLAIDFWKNGGMKAMAFNDASLLTCISNDFGYPHVFEKPIQMFGESGDCLLAISSSGRSENILKGTASAKEKNCPVITFSGFGGDNLLRKQGQLNFYVPSQSYGYVEITHLVLGHCLLDILMARRQGVSHS